MALSISLTAKRILIGIGLTLNIFNLKFLERKIGVTEHPRSLNPCKAITMAICPIIVHFIT